MSFLPVLAQAVSVIGTVYGAYSSAQAEKANAKGQEAAARYNQQQAELNAQKAREASKRESWMVEQKALDDIGRQRARLAQAGIINSATGKGLMADSRNNMESDKFNAAMSWGNQAANYEAQAGLESLYAANAANNAKTYGAASWINAGTKAFGGAGSIYDTWKGIK